MYCLKDIFGGFYDECYRFSKFTAGVLL